MAKISLIICTYNELGFADSCLKNLKKIREEVLPEMEVVVKDQGSTDGSRQLIEEEHPWVKLIKGRNDGLSKAYNLAYRATNSKYLLFLGMDAFSESNTIPGIIEYFDRHKEVGAATCELILGNGTLDKDAHRAFPTPWISLTRLTGLYKLFPSSRLFNGYFLPGKNMAEPHEIDLCISHFMMVRRKVLDQIGGFDERFFLYGEDVDVCYRIKKAGWKIMYLPQWKALHMKGGSVGIRKTTRKIVKRSLGHRIKMQKLSTEAMTLFLKKHYLGKYPKCSVYFMMFATKLLGFLRILSEIFR